MVVKVNLNEKELRDVYLRVRKETNNFKKIAPKIIAENCQTIVIFRLALGISVKKFAAICKRSTGSIDSLQRSPRAINYGVAEYYTKIIKSLWKSADSSLKNILKNYNLFYGRAIKGVKILSKRDRKEFSELGIKKSLERRKSNEEEYFKAARKGIEKQKLTKQEKRIKELLKKRAIQHETHKFLFNENLDFVINNKILVGCASGKDKNLTHHARRLMYQAYRVKYHNKKIKYVAFLSNNFGNLKLEEVPIGAVKLLNEICDAWFVDENIAQIIIFIAGPNLQAQQANDQ